MSTESRLPTTVEDPYILTTVVPQYYSSCTSTVQVLTEYRYTRTVRTALTVQCTDKYSTQVLVQVQAESAPGAWRLRRYLYRQRAAPGIAKYKYKAPAPGRLAIAARSLRRKLNTVAQHPMHDNLVQARAAQALGTAGDALCAFPPA